MPRILLVEDDNSLRLTISQFLEFENYEVEAVSTTRDALRRLTEGSYPIIISDIYLDERTGIDVLSAAKNANPECAVILMSGRGSMETVMAATRGGAFDYLAKPFELDDLIDVVRRAEKSFEADEEKGVWIDDIPDTDMIGSSAVMMDIFKTIAKVAPTTATVLIEGETGTGKELIARMVHRYSPRAEKPFVAVDCGAITPSLLESELFGAMRGAFTGADRDRIGVFESANLGTVFLDEIGEIDQAFQLKLLRFLQEHEVRPVGASKSKPVDVRIVAATNKSLRKMTEEKRFREDLLFRLNVVSLTMPPLRERRGDVPLLAQTFLVRYNERYSQTAELKESGVKALTSYLWPGNVRQLQHMMERMVILTPQGRIDEAAVRESIQAMDNREQASESLADTESDQIRKVLVAVGGNKSHAAKLLGIERKTLYRKLERMGIT